jgi:MFS transporter, AAHS family, 3-hydroxyphenylpropionic acid transporter
MDKASEAPIVGDSIVVIILCCLVAAFEGVDLQAPGLTIPVLGPLFHMTPGDKGLFLSISTFGMILGAAIGGRVSDLIGRKYVLIATVTTFGLLTIATAFSTSINMLLVARFLTGLGLGGALPNVIALVTESASFERRSTAVGFLYASLPCGGALASLIAALASRIEQWPVVYLVGGIAPLVLAPLLALVLRNRTPVPPTDVPVSPTGFVAALFGERRAVRTLLLWASFFLALLTMYLLLGWLPSLMGSRGLTRPQASMVQMAFNACGALGSVLTGLVLDRGRRTVVVSLVFAGAIASIGYLVGAPADFTLAVIGGGLVGATVSGTQTVLYDLAPSCYPSKVRGTGVGFAVAIGRVGSAVGPLLAAMLVGLGRSPAEVLMSLMPILAVSGMGAIVLAWGGRGRA